MAGGDGRRRAGAMTTAAVECELCPRRCVLDNYQRGDCRVRVNVEGRLYTLVFGKACSAHVDPIEKKPLFHFLPASRVYSIATAGCNLHCKFCQNWEISQTEPEDADNRDLEPERVIANATRGGCRSIAYTYSEPNIFYEYVLATSALARARGIKNVTVTAAYVNEAPLRELCRVTDASNADLKAYDDAFYRKICGGRLAPVLKALVLYKEAGVWLEVTNLIVPTLNDTDAGLTALCRWHRANLGAETPLHFSRFFPMYKMLNLPPTPEETLTRAWHIARAEGLKYAYVGNVADHPGNHTYCPGCGLTLVERQGYALLAYRLVGDECPRCHARIAGVWEPPRT